MMILLEGKFMMVTMMMVVVVEVVVVVMVTMMKHLQVSKLSNGIGKAR